MRKTEIAFAAGLTALAAAAMAHASPPPIGDETAGYSYDALGRLTSSAITGGPNNGRLTGTCFDPAGNRTRQDAATSALSACPVPVPTPTPSGNQPPSTAADSFTLLCNDTAIVDLTGNDSDPENNLPLSLVSISYVSGGGAGAYLVSSTSVSVTGDESRSTTTFSYVVQDSLGAQSTGTLSVVTVGPYSVCS